MKPCLKLCHKLRPQARHHWLASMLQLLQLALDVLLPRACAGCGALDETLCAACLSEFARFEERQVLLKASSIASCARYRGHARAAVLAWKDHGYQACDAPFARQLALLYQQWCAVHGVDTASDEAVCFVPAPSSLHSARKRDRKHMVLLVRRVTRILRKQGADVRMADVLRLHGVARKSVQTTSAAARSKRMAGHVRLVHPELVQGRAVVLCDDIVTTGATLRQCAHALELAGARVLVCLALAHSERT